MGAPVHDGPRRPDIRDVPEVRIETPTGAVAKIPVAAPVCMPFTVRVRAAPQPDRRPRRAA
jgi:hypothetical protein